MLEQQEKKKKKENEQAAVRQAVFGRAHMHHTRRW
jgi:hypothetical protein